MPEASGRAPTTLRDLAAVLVRRKWIVLVAVVVPVVVALVLSAVQTSVYEATAEVLAPPRGDDPGDESGDEGVDDRALRTEIELVESETVRDRVQAVLDLDEPPPEVSASAVTDADVLSLSVRDTNADNAAILADTYATVYVEVRREQSVEQLLAASAQVRDALADLRAEIDSLPSDDPRRARLAARRTDLRTTLDQLRTDAASGTAGAAVIRAADVPDDPVEPTPWRSAALALLVGLLVGLSAAFVVDQLDRRVRPAGEPGGAEGDGGGGGADRAGPPGAGRWPPPPVAGSREPAGATAWPAPDPTPSEPLAPPSPR